MDTAAFNHWSHLLGGHAVPDVRTGSAALVVSGKRCNSLDDVVRAVGLPLVDGRVVAVDQADGIDDLAAEHSLARIYYRRLVELQIGNAAGAAPHVPPSDGLTAKQRATKKWQEAHKAERAEYARQRREARKAADQQAAASGTMTEVEKALAAIDADSSLTTKQRSNRKYRIRHLDELREKAREIYLRRKAKEQSCA